AAALVAGDRAGGVEVVGRRDPDVEDAVHRRHPAQVRAVGADLHVGALGVAEQCLARDQVDLVDRGGAAAGGGIRVAAVAAGTAGGQGQGDAAGEQQGVVAHSVVLPGSVIH